MTVSIDQLGQYRQKCRTERRRQWSQNSLLRTHHACPALLQDGFACGREKRYFRALIVDAAFPPHQAPFRKPLKHIRHIGAIDPDLSTEADLIAAREIMQGRQQAILDRRYAELPALLDENGRMNLVETTDQITHARLQRQLLCRSASSVRSLH